MSFISNHVPISKDRIYFGNKSHIKSRYALVGCNYTIKYIRNTAKLLLHMNNHITSCRLGGSSYKSDSHIYRCMGNKKQEP